MDKNEELRKHYGEIMRDLRNSLEVTQYTLAWWSNYSVQTISKIENGKAPMSIAWHDVLLQLYNRLDEETYKKYEEPIWFMFTYFYDRWPALDAAPPIAD